VTAVGHHLQRADVGGSEGPTAAEDEPQGRIVDHHRDLLP
jgi:hypothetical protein